MDDKLSRKGHRQRVKDAYLKGSLETMPDHNLLELVLFYAIPQKDVKPLSYTLINHFGSLDKVFNASIEDLMMVDGVKEHTAILLSLFKSVNMRISQNNANEEIKLSSFEKISEFAANMLKDQKVENFLVITVASDDTIINSRIVSKGDVKTTGLKKKQLAELASLLLFVFFFFFFLLVVLPCVSSVN